MVKVRDVEGNKVLCFKCKTENLHEYKIVGDYKYFGWCIEHKGEGLKKYREHNQ